MIYYLGLLLVAEFIILCCLVYNDQKTWGFISILLAFGIYDLLFNSTAYKQWWHWIVTNPGTLFECILGWIVAGVIWSFFRWWTFLKKDKREQIEKQESYRNMKGSPYI